jgi:hypothetical protein
MKNTITIFLCFLLFSHKLFAQEKMQISKNAIGLDLFNFDRLYNLNYSRAFVKKKWAIIPKVGVFLDFTQKRNGYLTTFRTHSPFEAVYSNSRNAVNAGVDFLYGKRKHFFRFGINTMVSAEYLDVEGNTLSNRVFNYGLQPTLGYRFQKKKKGFYFSASFSSLVVQIGKKRNDLGEQVRFIHPEFFDSLVILVPRPGIGYSF